MHLLFCDCCGRKDRMGQHFFLCYILYILYIFMTFISCVKYVFNGAGWGRNLYPKRWQFLAMTFHITLGKSCASAMPDPNAEPVSIWLYLQCKCRDWNHEVPICQKHSELLNHWTMQWHICSYYVWKCEARVSCHHGASTQQFGRLAVGMQMKKMLQLQSACPT